MVGRRGRWPRPRRRPTARTCSTRTNFPREKSCGPTRTERFRFWNNFDQRPIDYYDQWPPTEPAAPEWRTWIRCRPQATFADPWIDAARTLIVLDVVSWPAGSRPHAHTEPSVHRPQPRPLRGVSTPRPSDDWLLLDGHSPVAGDGLMSWTGRIWTRDRHLVASGGGQAVFRHT